MAVAAIIVIKCWTCSLIATDVELMSLAPNDFRSVLKVVNGVQPQEIFSLAGQTSVGLSFEQPVECMELL